MKKEIIKGYKGFDKDLKCRGFQYEVGKEYSTDKAVACNTGFHYCECPMDVLVFYAPCDDTGTPNRFCEVEGSGDFDKSEIDKLCCTHLKVKAEIGLNGLIKAGVQFILNRVKWKDNKDANTGDCSAATNTGYRSAATNTGDCSAATNTGDRSAATNTGDCSAATTPPIRAASQPPPIRATAQPRPIRATAQPPPIRATAQPRPIRATAQPPPIRATAQPRLLSRHQYGRLLSRKC